MWRQSESQKSRRDALRCSGQAGYEMDREGLGRLPSAARVQEGGLKRERFIGRGRAVGCGENRFDDSGLLRHKRDE